MSVRYLSKITVLPIIATVAMIAGPTGFAADTPAKSGSMELKSKPVAQEKLNVKDLDEEVSHFEVVDSKGNAYLLIPLKTVSGESSAVAKDGKIVVEYVHPYTGRLGN